MKLKWTAEEEEALIAGVEKHGTGKWKNILEDPDFSDQLINRSNIDIKDKWRNLNNVRGTQGSKDKARPTKVKDEGVALPTVAASLPRSASSELLTIDDSSNIAVDTKHAPWYDSLIFEALSDLADANGSDVGSISNFIASRDEVPPNFRKNLSQRLRRLVDQGKLEKIQQSYKIPDPTETRTPAPKPMETNMKPRQSNNRTRVVSQEMIDEAVVTAAYKVVEAENKLGINKEAVEELEKITQLAEESEFFLETAKEILERCKNTTRRDN